MSEVINKLEVSKNGQVRVVWQDTPENYSHEGKSRIKSYFHKKYGVPSQQINVVFRPIKKDGDMEIVMGDAVVDNIMDEGYQRTLFKEWLTNENVKVDFDRIIKLDTKVNDILKQTSEIDTRYRRYKINKLVLDNFLSFGGDNHIPYDNLNGITVINSNPSNQGGKTNLTIDSLLFLFFNTTTKTDVAADIFNVYSNKLELSVKGYLTIDGVDYVMERIIKRKFSEKKGTWSTSGILNYYMLMPDGSERDLKEEERSKTDKLISETIGTQKDFLLTIMATASNLDSLIDTKATERGRLLTRYIGLEVLEKKEDIAKKERSNFNKKMKSNHYNIEELKTEIEESKTLIEDNKKDIIDYDKKIKDIENNLKLVVKEKEGFIEQKQEINDEINSINPESLKRDIDDLTKEGIELKEKINGLTTSITEIGDVVYDEDEHNLLKEEERSLSAINLQDNSKLETAEKLIQELENGKICPTCKQELKDVDHTEEIDKNKGIIKELTSIIDGNSGKIEILKKKLSEIDGLQAKINEKIRLELSKERSELEIDKLRFEVKEKSNLLKEYNKNLDVINKNKEIDTKVLEIEYKIDGLTTDKDNIIRLKQDSVNNIAEHEKQIAQKDELIDVIKKEIEVDKIYGIYLKLVGKNGISKLVLRTAIPIINAEIERLMDNSCDFNVELSINEKNEVDFLLVKDDVYRSIKSGSGLERTIASLTLRSVLGMVSTLPKPNFIIFDEVLGKVANENLDKIGLFLDKIKDIYEIIFFITHNPIAKDWADNIIMINKENNTSSVKVR